MQPIPAFVGVDFAVYGPFNEGEVAVVPQPNARILIDRKVAEEVEQDA